MRSDPVVTSASAPASDGGRRRADPTITKQPLDAATPKKRNRTRANSEGTVVHDKARGRYRAAITTGYDIDGRQRRKWVTGRTKKDVLARLRDLQNATDAGQEPARRNLTVAKFLDQWLGDVLPGSVAPTTETNYANVVRLYLKPNLGQKRLTTLQARDVAAMLRPWRRRARRPTRAASPGQFYAVPCVGPSRRGRWPATSLPSRTA